MSCSSPAFVVDKSSAGRMTVDCGRCAPCRIKYRTMWAIRMMDESKVHEENVMVTLTYNDEFLPEGSNLSKEDCQEFLKRLREDYNRDIKYQYRKNFIGPRVQYRKIRYYLAGEYGEDRQRPHYHAIIFGLGKKDYKLIEDAWMNGFIHVGDVNSDSCNYVAKYINKKLMGADALHYKLANVVPEFALMSRRPGIGDAHVKKYGGEMRNRGHGYIKGAKVGLPRFYKSKIYADDEGRAIQDERWLRFDLDNIRKRLDNIKIKGYTGADKVTLLQREKAELEAKAKNRQRREKL